MLARACAICLEEARPAARLDDCGHAFCRPCLAAWLRRSELCPLCQLPARRVDGRGRAEHFPAAAPAPAEPTEPGDEHFGAELESLLGHLQALSRKLDFYRHQAFYGALKERVFLDLRRWERLLERLRGGTALAGELPAALEQAHLLACRLESGLGPLGPAGLAQLVEEEGDEDY